MSAIELEKQNLEMHVALADIREKALRDSLDALGKKIDDLSTMHKELRQLIEDIKDKRNDQLLKWGSTIIIALLSTLTALLIKVILPAILKLSGH